MDLSAAPGETTGLRGTPNSPAYDCVGRRHGLVDSRQKTTIRPGSSSWANSVSEGSLSKKFILPARPSRQTPVFRMRWQSSSVSMAWGPDQYGNVVIPSEPGASEARLLRPGRFCGGSAFGSLFRISTCKDKELTILKW